MRRTGACALAWPNVDANPSPVAACRGGTGERDGWYEERREGLGGELLALARESFERILEAPHQLPSWVGDRAYRRLVLERFPYSIIFTYDDAEVRIVAFAHGRRKPGYWRT